MYLTHNIGSASALPIIKSGDGDGERKHTEKERKENDKGGKGSPKVGKKNLLVNFKGSVERSSLR